MPRQNGLDGGRLAPAGSKRKPKTPPPRPSNAYLASLKTMTMRNTKMVLPMDLMSKVLEYLPMPALFRVAQTSRRMKEAVYDEARWQAKLKLMGVWDEAEARQRLDEPVKSKPVQSPTLFDIDSGQSPKAQTPISKPETNGVLPDPKQLALQVFERTRSGRRSRHEFGKIYKALAPYYHDLFSGLDSEQSKLFLNYDDPVDQAKMLVNMRTFARSDSALGAGAREQTLDSLIARFENSALHEFSNGCRVNDYGGRMHRYAHVLATLNGGAAAVDYFIENNQVRKQKQSYGHPLACLEGYSGNLINLSPSQSFFHALSRALDDQVSMIDLVFPADVEVMLPFLGRLCDDVISDYINPLFDEAHSTSKEAYIQLVPGVFEQSQRFAASLYPSQHATADFHERAQRLVTDCFEPHVDTYLFEEFEDYQRRTISEVEVWEQQLFAKEASTESFFMSNVSRQAAKSDFLKSFKKVIMMPVNVLPGLTHKPEHTEPTEISRPTEIERSSTPLPEGIDAAQAPTNELAAKAALMNSRLEGISGLFSIEVALTLVHLSKASTERIAQFTRMREPYDERAKAQARKVFVHLLQVLGHRHVKNGFDRAVTHLQNYKARDVSESSNGVRPLLTFLELVNVGDLIQQMVDVFWSQEFVANKLADRDDFLDPAVKEKKRFEQMLDERVAAGLGRGIDVLMDEVEHLAATTQGLQDYRPGTWSEATPAQPAVVDIGPTQTARRVVDLIASHTDMLAGAGGADKNMLDVFNGEVGVRLFAALCKHLKRQRVSTDGAIVLIADANHYAAFAATLRNKELLRYFAVWRELAHIYLVDGARAAELAAMIADGARWQGVLRVEEVLEYAERRADWAVIQAKVEKALYGIGCVVM